jgi:hypothetical protein
MKAASTAVAASAGAANATALEIEQIRLNFPGEFSWLSLPKAKEGHEDSLCEVHIVCLVLEMSEDLSSQ